MVRNLDLKKPPSIAESIDWARALLLLGADDIDQSMLEHTMSIIVKHRTDLDVVAERVGVKLTDGLVGGRPVGLRRPPGGAAGFAPRLLEFADELRARGHAGRHVRAARRVRRAAARAVDERGGLPLRRSPPRSRSRRRTGACSTSCSTATSSARWSARPSTAGSPRSAPGGDADGERLNLDLRACASRSGTRSARASDGEHARPRAPRDRGLRARRARARRDRRGRPAHPPHARPEGRRASRSDRASPTPTRCRASGCASSSAICAASWSASMIERTQALPPARPLREFDRALPDEPAPGPRRGAPRGVQLKRRLATQGTRCAAAAAASVGGRAAHDAGLARDRRRPAAPALPAQAPAPAGAVRALRRLHQRDQRERVLPVGAARAARLVPQAALVRVRRADLRGHRGLRARALVQGGLARDRDGRRRGRRVGLHRLRPRLARVPRARWSTTSTRAPR